MDAKDSKQIVAVLLFTLGLTLIIFPNAVAVIGLSVHPTDQFSDQVYKVQNYRGYEIWCDPEREPRGYAPYIVYTPPGVIPALSSLAYTQSKARSYIDNMINYYDDKYGVIHDPTPDDDPPESVPCHMLTISAGDHGTVKPLGTYQYQEGTDVWITALPDSGYTIDYWLVDGVEKEPHAPGPKGMGRLVVMDANHEVVGYFKVVPVLEDNDVIEDDLIESQYDQLNEGAIPRSYVQAGGLGAVIMAAALVKEELLEQVMPR